MKKQGKKVYEAAIIGGGIIGMYCAYYATLKNITCCLIEKTNEFGGQLNLYKEKKIYDIPFIIDTASKFVGYLKKQLDDSKIKYFKNTNIISIKKINNIFEITTNLFKIYSKNIIIATGIGIPTDITLDIKNADSKKIIYNVNNKNKFKNKKIIILGGGDSAVDWANELSGIAESISLVHRRDTLRAQNNHIKSLRKNKINLFLNYSIEKIDGNKLIIKHNDTNKNVFTPFDFIIVQYGKKFTPYNIVFSERISKDNNNKLIVDGCTQETSSKNTYAIGDVCIYKNKTQNIVSGFGEVIRCIQDIINKKEEN